MGEIQDGLENITENLAQAYNKQRNIPRDALKVAHETAKYYERGMCTGVLVRPQLDLTNVRFGGSKSVEDLRKVAMEIKELKDIHKTRRLIAQYYGVNIKKVDDALIVRFNKDCESAVDAVRQALETAAK